MVQTFDISSHISKHSANRTQTHFVKTRTGNDSDAPYHPSPIILSGGLPNPNSFCVESITLSLSTNPRSKPRPGPSVMKVFGFELANDIPLGSKTEIPYNGDLVIEKYADPQLEAAGKTNQDNLTLDRIFQYGPMQGYPSLIKFCTELVKIFHPPRLPQSEWGVIMTDGGGDGLYKVIDLLVDPGDNVLVEEFSFTPTYDNIRGAGGVTVPVKMTKEEGLDPKDLRRILENWESDPNLGAKYGRKPRALYTIPSGQNPYGVSQTLETRKEVYEICKSHDVIILEDDPYGCLAFPGYTKGSPQTVERIDEPPDEFIKNLAPSYITIDDCGLVIRVETFSKVFSPGIRLGWIVAHKSFIERILLHTIISTKSPSGLSQAVINNIVQKWGIYGWIKWVSILKEKYVVRRDALLNAIDNLENENIEYVVPHCGMFVSATIKYQNHPKYQKGADGKDDFTDLQDRLCVLCSQEGVDVVSGIMMGADKETSKRGNFLRLTFAYQDADEIEEGILRLGKALTRLWKE